MSASTQTAMTVPTKRAVSNIGASWHKIGDATEETLDSLAEVLTDQET